MKELKKGGCVNYIKYKCSLILLVATTLSGCATIDGSYFYDKRTHWARSLTSEDQRISIMDRVRPLAEDVLACDQLYKIVLDDLNTNEKDFKSEWTETWKFFGCEKATYFTVQYFKEIENDGSYLSYRLINGAACTGALRYIDNYKCAKADEYYRRKPELREKKRI